MQNLYDVAIIGSGPGGYIAGIKAGQLGLKTAVIEAEEIGGTCLNWGCIATKSLLAGSDMLRQVKSAAAFGIKVEGVSYDFPFIFARSRKIIAKMRMGIKYLFKKNNVDFIEARAFIKDNRTIELTDKEGGISILKTNNIIIATGSAPAEIEGIETDGDLIMNSRHALLSDTLPSSVLIIGGGAVGLEFADFYNAFGTSVTLTEFAPHILPTADEEIATFAEASFKKQGINILTSTKATSIHKENGKAVVTFANKDGGETKGEFAKVIIAVGVTPNIKNIGLENLPDIKLEKDHIVTDGLMRTGAKGVYAIGDITAAPWLGHKAMAEGVIAARAIKGEKDISPINPLHIPFCIYSHPQIAGFGLTEAKAKSQGLDISVGKFPLMANSKAVTSGQTEGLIKLITDKQNGEILGAWLLGDNVTELINAVISESVKDKIFPHPTLSEIIPEAYLAATLGSALNI